MSKVEESREDLCEILREFELLRGVSEEQLRELASIGKVVTFPEGAMVFREEEPASKCYLIVDGVISLEFCAPVSGCAMILTVSQGELLGWSPLVGGEQLTASARASTDVRMVELDAKDVLAMCERSPEFGYRFLRGASLALAKRLTATRLQLLDMFANESSPLPLRSG